MWRGECQSFVPHSVQKVVPLVATPQFGQKATLAAGWSPFSAATNGAEVIADARVAIAELGRSLIV